MTKAATRGAKRKRKRGRPLLPANDREPNGQYSRRVASVEARETEMTEAERRDNISVAVSRRIRHLGLVDLKIEGKLVTAEEQATDTRRGYVLGRLCISGKLTTSQLEVGNRYATDVWRYYVTCMGMKPTARAQDLFAVRATGDDMSDSQRKADERSWSTMKEIQSTLFGAFDNGSARKIIRTLNSACVDDVDQAAIWPEPMLHLLRQGLNVLGRRHYEVEM